jgi:hypothetical protein
VEGACGYPCMPAGWVIGVCYTHGNIPVPSMCNRPMTDPGKPTWDIIPPSCHAKPLFKVCQQPMGCLIVASVFTRQRRIVQRQLLRYRGSFQIATRQLYVLSWTLSDLLLMTHAPLAY